MRRNRVRIFSVLLGVLVSISGVFLIGSAYHSWQHYYMLGDQVRLGGAIGGIIGAVAVFFIAALLFIADEFYKNASVRFSALFAVIGLALIGVIGVIEAFMTLYLALTWDSVMGAYALMGGLVACLALGTAFILVLKIRQAGWLLKWK